MAYNQGLYIDTSGAASDSLGSLKSPSALQSLPSFQLSPSPDIQSKAPKLANNADIARDRMEAEKRKALAFLIGQLQNRPRVPSAFEAFRSTLTPRGDKRGFSPIASLIPAPASFAALRTREPNTSPGSTSATRDSDDEDDTVANSQYALCGQVAGMCNFLINASRDGWQGLNQSYTAPVAEPKSPTSSSPFRRRGSDVAAATTPSPTNPTSSSTLLSQCIAVLASLVSEDCRLPPPRPTVRRPPYTLHAHTLDFATALAETQFHNPGALVEIGFAMIPAFGTFPSPLLNRLVRLFENDLLRPMLNRLRAERLGGKGSYDLVRGYHPDSDDEPGMISIHVDEVRDADGPTLFVPQAPKRWNPWSSSSKSEPSRVISSAASRQPQLVYRLSSLIGPLLSALFNVPNLSAHLGQLELAYEVCRLLDMIVECKPDAYVDVLEVLAFHTSDSRPFTAGALTTFWPRAFGHVFVGSPLPTFSYNEVLRRPGPHPLAHQFMIWRFGDTADAPHSDCQVCSQTIMGLGLLCPFCMCCVHMNCYDNPDGTFIRPTPNQHQQRGSATRASPVLKFSRILPTRRGASFTVFHKGHRFNLVNLFTLTLCAACQKPLWGMSMQAYMCAGCGVPVHRGCVDSSPTCRPSAPQAHHSVDLQTLRRSFVDHYGKLLWPESELIGKSYEELSTAYCVLWTQLQTLRLGQQNFTINVEAQVPGAPKEEMADFELHYLVRLYQAQLSALRYDMSPVLHEFLHPRAFVADHMVLYDWSLLAYSASLIKTPMDDPADNDLTHSPSQDLLSAATSTFDRGDGADDAPHAFEVVEIAHLRDVLGHELQLASDRAAVEMLQHIANLGFFVREDGEPILDASVETKRMRCTFPLPIALDVNGDHVETLVSAIEASLDDLNVTINEVGFLLLVRRCWPSSRHTDYALSRLARVVLQWIFAEDDRLVVVARDYDRPGIPVPGVPAPTDVYPWPKGAGLQEAQRVSSYYVGYRRFLLQRYALRWLRALHDQDPGFYATAMFTHATDLAAEMDQLEQTDDSEEAKVDNMVARADQILKLITKLCQSSVIFSTFDAVMLQWLEAITSLCMLSSQAIVFRSLPRLCNPETDRTSVSLDNMVGAMADRFPTIDLWRVVDETAQKGGDDLLQALQWMRIMAQSGVDIPMSTFKQLAGVVRDNNCPLPQAMTLVEAMVAAAWLKPMRKQALQRLISHMHGRYCSSICEEFKTASSPTSLIQFIRQSMAVCLLLAGCERDKIVAYGLLERAEVEPLPLRRTTANTRDARPDPLDTEFVGDLVRYVTEGPEIVAAYIAAFFTLLLAEPNLLDSSDIQGLVVVNGHQLALCVWHLYDIQLHSLSVLRMKFLLHVLVVDAQPLENILKDIFDSKQWELRFQALTRLFRIVLDVTNPQFYVDGQQWRSAIATIFVYFFEAMWADERETIKLAADTWLQTLLPAHMEAIAACWDAYVSSAPVSGRARLIAFLIQLQPHFPKWQTLTWGTIEVLLDTLYSRAVEDESFTGPTSGHGIPSTASVPTLGQDVDASKQRVALLALSLHMIANGITIPVRPLLKLKQHLVRTMGFALVDLAPTSFGGDYHVVFRDLQELQESAYPCMNPLLKVLDAAEYIKYPLSAMGVESETDPVMDGLIGEFFVDVSLRILSNATNLAKLPYVVQRALIEALIVIIHKHDVEHNQALKVLQQELRSAVRAATDLLVLDASYDIRHLALTTGLVFLKRHPKLCTKIINHQVSTVMTLLSGLKPSNEDMLVVHGRNFLTTAFSQFTNNGLFWNLAKKPLSPSVFSVLQVVLHDPGDPIMVDYQSLQGDSMKDLVLRSTLTLALDQSDEVAMPTVLNNLNLFVELVHHQDLSTDMIQLVGSSLSNLARQTTEWDSQAFDPNPLLTMTATIVLHNRAQSRELLAHLDVFLRAALGRFNVNKDTIDKMLQVASAYAKRGASSNLIAVAILDVLSDALHGKARMTTVTLRSVTEMLSMQPLRRDGRQQLFPTDHVVQAAADAMLYLCTMSVPDRYQQSDVYAFLSIAGLVLRAAVYELSFLPTAISSTRMRVRTWNLLVLQALREGSSQIAAQLFGHLQIYAQTFEMELQMALNGAATATFPSPGIIGDVTHAATGVRLWLLLARRRFMVEPQVDSALEDAAAMYDEGLPRRARPLLRTDDGETNSAEWRVWHELWPALERFARALVADEGIVASGTVADLAWAQLVDLVHFVRLAQSAVAMETSTFAALLERMRNMPLEKSLSSKLARTVNAFDQPTVPVAYDALVAQTADQLWVAEKAYSAGSMGRLAGGGAGRREYDAARRRLANVTAVAGALDPVTLLAQKTFG
ncbi:hypothetical protein AURDEDRAFT_180591 [Auricularia subglabra TFB-10046 SS5]|nr:hypothetical protein AURDEDRAFT_180591 [Auricularia subglabra TFB-10046 SS5]